MEEIKKEDIVEETTEGVVETDELSDEDIDMIANTVSENEKEFEKAVEEASKDHEDEEGTETFTIDPESGEEDLEFLDREVLPESDASITEVIDGKVEEDNQEGFEAAAKENATTMFDLSDADCAQLISVMNKFREDEKMNVMKELPKTMQEKIRQLAAAAGVQGNQINSFAKVVLKEFIKEAMMDKEYVDLMTSIEKEFKIPSIIDMYSEHVKETMEVKLIETAKSIEAEYPEKAKALREVSRAFTESYTYDQIIECYKSDRQVRKGCKHPENLNKICSNFNHSLEDSKFKISDISTLHPILMRVFKDDETITSDDLAKFVIMFCKTFEFHCNPKGLADVAYAYYTIKNIVSLDYSYEKKTEFTETVINNIRKVISFIHENTL